MRKIVEELIEKLDEASIKNELGVGWIKISDSQIETYKKELNELLEDNDSITNQYLWCLIKQISEEFEKAVG